MEIASFTSNKTGKLVDIVTSTGRDAHAFVPESLPETWHIPQSLWPLVAQARDQVGRLEGIRGILPNPGLLLQPLQRREALRSSSLEGTYATPEELLLYEIEEELLANSNKVVEKQSAGREVFNCCEALRQGNNWLTEGRKLNTALICDLHGILMSGVPGEDENRGKLRNDQVFIGRPSRFIPPPHDHLNECLNSLGEFMQSSEDSIDPLVRVFIVHYQFEAIHPFFDGNGRIGRVLLSLCARDWLKLSLPWLYMSAYFERNRREYIDRLFRVSTNGEWDEWLRFCLQGAIEESQQTIIRCQRIEEVRSGYLERIANQGPRLHEIVDQLFHRPMLRTSQVVALCGKSRETARKDLHKLVELNILTSIKDAYPSTFAAEEIIEAAYGESEPAQSR